MAARYPTSPSPFDDSDFDGLAPLPPSPAGDFSDTDFADFYPAPRHTTPTWGDTAITTGLRVIPGLAAGFFDLAPGVGNLVGGGLTGAGETGAEYYEKARGIRSEINPTQIATQTALGAVPFAAPFKELSGVGGMAMRSLAHLAQGAAIGAAGDISTQAAERGPGGIVNPQNWPTMEQALEEGKRGAMFGGAFGGVIGGASELAGLRRGAAAAEREASIARAHDPSFDSTLDELLAETPTNAAGPGPLEETAAPSIEQPAVDGADQSVVPPNVDDLYPGLSRMARAEGKGPYSPEPSAAREDYFARDQAAQAERPANLERDLLASLQAAPPEARLEPADEEAFQSLLQDAIGQGYTGADSELRSVYADRLAEANDLADEMAGLQRSTGNDRLLEEIAALGGLSRDEGLPGELAWLKEGGDSRDRFGSLQGVRGVFRNKTGKTFDMMREALNDAQEMRSAGGAARFPDVNSLIDALTERVQPRKAVQRPDVQGVLEGALQVKPGERWWEPFGQGQDLQLLENEPTATNASGESMASQEAMNRQASMKSQGKRFVVYDRAGNERPLIGPEAVDYNPRPGETYGVANDDGSFTPLTDNGGRVPGADVSAGGGDLLQQADHSEQSPDVYELPMGAGDGNDPDAELQALMDYFKDPEAESSPVDVNQFGEAQSRLPGEVGAVRDTEVPTPEFEAPFSLQAERGASSPEPVAANEPDLFDRLSGETGSISPVALSRVAGGVGGALYGGATGKDKEDRITRALLFGAGGALAAGGAAGTAAEMFGSRERPAPVAGRGAGVEDAGAAEAAAPAAAPREAGTGEGVTPKPRGNDKFANNTNLERIESPEDVKSVIKETARSYKGQIEAQKRGVVKQVVTRQLAADLGYTEQELLATAPGTAANAETALAARNTMVGSAKRVVDAAAAVRENPTPENTAAFMASVSRHVGLQASVSGLTAEAGRALAQFRMMSRSPSLAAINEAMAAGGGEEKLQALADRLLKLDPTNLRQINQFTREAAKATTTDQVYEAWRNALLSGPVTHIANMISNGLTAGTMPIEKGIAAALDAVRSTARGTPRERFFREATDAAVGMWKGIIPGLKAGLESFRTEMDQFGTAGKAEAGAEAGAIPGVAGRIVRLPQRLLGGEDEFFKNILYSADIHSRAVRQALQEGKTGKAVGERAAEILQNPTQELTAKSQKEALYRTFNVPLTSEAERALYSLRRNVPGARWIVPFLRTPVNIAKFGVERTPLSVLGVMNGIRKGTLKGGDLSDEAAKTVLGAMISLGVAAAFKNGLITGGGSPNRAKHQTLATVRPDYSIKVGNQWVSYQRTEPLGITAGLTADFLELMNRGEGEEVLPKLLGSISRNLESKTFLAGVTDFFNVLTDPDQYGDQWIRKQAGSVVPTAVAQVQRTMDPTWRKPRSVAETIESRLPGVSRNLPPQPDVFGRPITSKDTAAERLLSPFRRQPVVDDPLVQEMERLGVFIQTPSDRFDDKTVKLDRGEASALQLARGQEVRHELDALVDSDFYQGLDDTQKRDRMKRVIQGARARVSRRAHTNKRAGRSVTLDDLLLGR